MAGGHLERDAYYFKKISKDISSKKIIGEMIKFNNKRKILLEEEIKNINNSQICSILIVGFSYKKDSFSIVNSPFTNLLKNKKFNVSVYDDYYQLPKIKNLNKINNLNSLKKFNILIYNYSNKKSLELIKRHLKNIKKIHLINMSMINSKIFNEKNIKNIFCDPTKHIK
jgi:UDP-N-acetyl-D-mannosaminuronate dehydrogenase